MSIVLVGLNHKTAPVEVRERLAFSDDACAHVLKALVDGEVVEEALIVSTCNRVEVLTSTRTSSELVSERITQFLGEGREVSKTVFVPHLYSHLDDSAVRHIFRVASSLDSMVVGEPQILGQGRRAYSLAVSAGTAGRVLNRLVHQAFRVAKRVRSETGIAASAVSISYMAVELGRKIFGSLSNRSVLLVGAGEMAELSARHLVNAGVSKVTVANRTIEAAAALAGEFGGAAVSLEGLIKHLAEADIVICSTGAPSFVISARMAHEAMEIRRNKPSFYIDISVPRNVDPAVGSTPNLFLFDIDDLESVIASNIREREREAERAERIIDAEVIRFQQSLKELEMGPTIGALRKKLQDIAHSELNRYRSKLNGLSTEQQQAVEALLMSTVNKISHPLMGRMRRSYETGQEENVQAWRDIFGLEDDPGLDNLDDDESPIG